MDYNLLSNILSYSNKYDILIDNAVDERTIVVHLAKISYIYYIERQKIIKYNIQVTYLNKVIKSISKHFGSKKVTIHEYLSDNENLKNPGCVFININGYTLENEPIFIKTDMSYELKKKSKSKYKKLGPIIVTRKMHHKHYQHYPHNLLEISEEFKDIKNLIKAISNLNYYYCTRIDCNCTCPKSTLY